MPDIYRKIFINCLNSRYIYNTYSYTESIMVINYTGLQITTNSDITRLIIGSTVSSIKCSSDLDVTRVEWYQGNDKTISSYGSYSYLRHSGIVTTDDEGLQYRCLAIGPYSTQDKNITFSVKGTYNPCLRAFLSSRIKNRKAW